MRTARYRILSEKNTVHAFGINGNETSGWPNHGYAMIGTRMPNGAVYHAPRASRNDLGGSVRRRRRHKTRKRRHPTQSIGV